MSKTDRSLRWIAHIPSTRRFTFVLLAIISMGCLFAAPAYAEPDDEFLDIVAVIHDADSLNASEKNEAALAKYKQAQTNLLNFRKTWPTWNIKMVAHRLAYVQEKITQPTAPAASAPKEGAPTKAESSDRIKLVQAGDEQKQLLRLKPQPGETQSLSFNLKLSMEMKMGEVSAPATPMPGMTVPMNVTVKSVDENGDINYEMTFGEVAIDDASGASEETVKGFKDSFAHLKNLSGTGKISARGINLAVNLKNSSADAQTRQLTEQMKESLANLTLPFPQEAVGAGAKWESRQSVKTQGINLTQTTTYELVSVKGTQVTLKTSTKQNAGSQKVQSPAMPKLQMDLVKLTGSGSGEAVVDLAKALPTAAKANSQTETVLSMKMGEQKQTMSTKMQTQLQLESK